MAEGKSLTPPQFHGLLSRRDFLKGGIVGGLYVLTRSPFGMTYVRAAPASGSRLVVGWASAFPTLHWNWRTEAGAEAIYDAVFESLVGVDPYQGGRLTPGLAESWRLLDRRTVWQFKLRSGVRFHNGEELVAESVKVVLERIMTQDPPSPRRGRLALFDRAEVVDRYTINLHTKEPWPLLPTVLVDVDILPAQHLLRVGDEAFAREPVGSGPYQVTNWQRGGDLTLTKSRTYWGKAPAMDGIVIRPILEDATRVAALEAGEVDLIKNVPVDEVERLKRRGFSIFDGRQGEGLVVNIQAQMYGDRLGWIKDRRVRQAINYAIDKDTIIKQILRGFGIKLDGQPVGRDCFGHNPNVKAYPYDPNRAKQLLDRAGYSNSIVVEFAGSEGRWVGQREAALAINEMLNAVGIKSQFKFMEWTAFVRAHLTEKNQPPLFMSGWKYMPVMDASFALQWFRTDSPFMNGPGLKEFDEVMTAANREFDVQKRRAMLQKANLMLNAEAASGFLWQSHAVYAARERVKNFRVNPAESVDWSTTALG